MDLPAPKGTEGHKQHEQPPGNMTTSFLQLWYGNHCRPILNSLWGILRGPAESARVLYPLTMCPHSCQPRWASSTPPRPEFANQGWRTVDMLLWTRFAVFVFFGVHKISEGPVPPRGSWQSRRFLRGKLAAHLRWAGAGWDNQGLDGWGYCFPAELQGTEVRGTDIINKKKNKFHKYSEGPAIWPHWSRWRGYRWIKHRVPAMVMFTFCGKKVNDVLGDNTRVSGEFSKCNGQIWAGSFSCMPPPIHPPAQSWLVTESELKPRPPDYRAYTPGHCMYSPHFWKDLHSSERGLCDSGYCDPHRSMEGLASVFNKLGINTCGLSGESHDVAKAHQAGMLCVLSCAPSLTNSYQQWFRWFHAIYVKIVNIQYINQFSKILSIEFYSARCFSKSFKKKQKR